MLRRLQPIDDTSQPQPGAAAEAPAAEPSGIERRRHPRISVDGQELPRRGDPVPGERRKADRRGLDALRAEVHFNHVSEAKDWRIGRGSSSLFGRFGMKPSRIALLLVALISGGLAAFMAIRDTPEGAGVVETVTEVVPEARVQVLVASQAITIGQRLTPATIAWQEWPEGALLPDYITMDSAPEALEEMADTVARFDIFAGDPIREQKLVRDSEGYLSAVLNPGMRGVSVSVNAETASGGFISPNDRVDVLLTRTEGPFEGSDIILYNVRVLAIGLRPGEMPPGGNPDGADQPPAPYFTGHAVATLELDPERAKVLVGATTLGEISLVLRAMDDFSAGDAAASAGANQAIRLTSPFWTNQHDY